MRASWIDMLLIASVAVAAAACVFSLSVHRHAWHAPAAASSRSGAVERLLSDLVNARCLEPETQQ